MRRWAQGLPNPHHHLAARVAASEVWILVRTCPSRWWGSPPVPTSPLDGVRAPSLHSCWALCLHQKPYTAHVGLCGLQVALTAREPLTGNSAWGHTHRRQRCRLGDRLGDTGETTASCLCAGRPSGLLLCLQKYVKGNAGWVPGTQSGTSDMVALFSEHHHKVQSAAARRE